MKFYKTTLDGQANRPLELGRGNIRDLIGPPQGAKNVDVHINIIEPGTGRGEIHYHRKTENIYIVLEGCLEVCLEGGERHTLSVGEVGFIPPGVIHTAANADKKNPVRIIEIYAPAGTDFHEVEFWPSNIAPNSDLSP